MIGMCWCLRVEEEEVWNHRLFPRTGCQIGGQGPGSGRWPRTRWSLWQSSRVPLWRWDNHLCSTPPNQASMKPLFSKRHMTAHLEFAKRHLKDSQTIKNKILWSDETKIELFGLNAKHHIWRKPATMHYGEAWWWQHHDVGCFSGAGTGSLIRIEGKMNGAKHREILDENLIRALRTSDWGKGSPSTGQRP